MTPINQTAKTLKDITSVFAKVDMNINIQVMYHRALQNMLIEMYTLIMSSSFLGFTCGE